MTGTPEAWRSEPIHPSELDNGVCEALRVASSLVIFVGQGQLARVVATSFLWGLGSRTALPAARFMV